MWTCPNCKIDIEPGFDVCWGCGTSRDGEPTPGFDPEAEGIIGAEQYAAETEAKRVENLVTLATFQNAPEAYVVRSRLEAEGIAAIVTDELAMSRMLDSSAAVKLEVPEEQLEKALDIVGSIRHGMGSEQHVIAQEVQEGIRTDLPGRNSASSEDLQEGDSSENQGLLIHRAFRAAIIGMFIFFLPVHIYSLYLLVRASNLPGEPDSSGRWKFWLTLCIDIPVIVFLWLPSNLCLLWIVARIATFLLRLV